MLTFFPRRWIFTYYAVAASRPGCRSANPTSERHVRRGKPRQVQQSEHRATGERQIWLSGGQPHGSKSYVLCGCLLTAEICPMPARCPQGQIPATMLTAHSLCRAWGWLRACHNIGGFLHGTHFRAKVSAFRKIVSAFRKIVSAFRAKVSAFFLAILYPWQSVS